MDELHSKAMLAAVEAETAPLCAQVARLEAANAAMAAALVEPVNDSQGRPTLRGCKACRNLWKKDGPEKHLNGCVLAALSDTAGEGWLPPGVREQAREALKQARLELMGIVPVVPFRTVAQVELALDALAVK